MVENSVCNIRHLLINSTIYVFGLTAYPVQATAQSMPESAFFNPQAHVLSLVLLLLALVIVLLVIIGYRTFELTWFQPKQQKSNGIEDNQMYEVEPTCTIKEPVEEVREMLIELQSRLESTISTAQEENGKETAVNPTVIMQQFDAQAKQIREITQNLAELKSHQQEFDLLQRNFDDLTKNLENTNRQNQALHNELHEVNAKKLAIIEQAEALRSANVKLEQHDKMCKRIERQFFQTKSYLEEELPTSELPLPSVKDNFLGRLKELSYNDHFSETVVKHWQYAISRCAHYLFNYSAGIVHPQIKVALWEFFLAAQAVLALHGFQITLPDMDAKTCSGNVNSISLKDEEGNAIGVASYGSV